jgi:hypothetical protein
VRAGDDAEQAEALTAGVGEKRAVHAEIRKGSRPPSVRAREAKPRPRAASPEEGGLKQRAGEKTPAATEDFRSPKLMEGSGSCRPAPRSNST